MPDRKPRFVTRAVLIGMAYASLVMPSPAQPAPDVGVGSGAALNARQLAQNKHCFDCHDSTRPRVGPSFRDLARRLGGLNNSRLMLARMIRTGTDNDAVFYHWGPSTMPPDSIRVPVSDEEAQVLADYVLSFAPARPASP